MGTSFGIIYWINNNWESPKANTDVKIFVKPGFNSRQIATLLKNEKVIKSAFLFTAYIKLLAIDNRLRPGTYHFSGNENVSEVVTKILKGTMKSVVVTIPEGLTIQQIASILQENGICQASEFIDEVSNSQTLKDVFEHWEPLMSPQGLAFPDTYYFERPTPASIVAKRMLLLTKHRIDKIFVPPIKGNLSQYQAAILASIVEKEAALPQERSLISSVFHNRLKKNMRLESCATILYALGKHKGRILYKDLEIDSPYNTYKRVGLPPTPISNFGIAAMQAVANPQETDYLFFVSDGKMGHNFSKTLSEHNKNKKIYFEQR